jgi:hypothetical protein
MMDKRFFHRFKYLIFSTILAASLASCTSVGPTILPPNREAYNRSLAESSNSQMLLNIVRLRYGDTPYFLNVDTISAAMEFTTSGNAKAGFSHTTRKPSSDEKNDELLKNAYSENAVAQDVGIGVSFTDKPTILYRPLQGSIFADQTLSPIDMQTLYWLNQSGWRLSEIFRICGLRVAGLSNAPEASRLASSRAPDYLTYKLFVDKLDVLELNHIVRIEAARLKQEDSSANREKNTEHRTPELSASNGNVIAMRVIFTGSSQQKQQYMQWLQMLHTQQFLPTVNFIHSSIPKINANTFGIQTRSLMGILYLFSKGVDLPEEAIQNKTAPITYDNGHPFDWQQVLANLFHVYYQNNYPAGAYLAIQHRGGWYYIADDDIKSKETFDLLQLIFSIQAGDSRSAISVTPVISV